MAWRRRALVAAGAAVAIWLASGELAWPARALLVFLLAVLPAVAVAQAEVVEGEVAALPRVPVYLSSSATLWALAAVTLAGARAAGMGAADLGLVGLGVGEAVGWTVAAVAGAVGLAAAWRALRVRESPVLVLLLPRTPVEKALFVGVSLSAGVGEEVVFRGFLVPALAAATGYGWLAVALAAAVFGVVHAYQNPAGVVRAGLLGVLLTVPLLATESLVPSMLAHFLYDVLAGLWLAERLLRRR